MIGFEKEEDARRVLDVLPKRFEKYGLKLHPTKTRLVAFSPRPQRAGTSDKEEKSTSFDFLGFTHYWGKSRKGWFVIKRKTAHKRLSRSLQGMSQWMRQHLHWPIREQWAKLKQKLQGHYGYYGITGNAPCLEQYHDAVKRLWHKWLNRRVRRVFLPANVTVERQPVGPAQLLKGAGSLRVVFSRHHNHRPAGGGKQSRLAQRFAF